MNIKKIIITLISIITGFYFSYILSSKISIFLFEIWLLKEDSCGELFGMCMGAFLTGVLVIYAIWIISILIAILFGLISLGLFNSKNWHINRYIFIILIPVLILGLFFLANIVLGYFNNIDMKNKYSSEICKNITDEKQRSECFYYASIYQKDFNLCENVTIPTNPFISRDSCYGHAGDSKSIFECQMIKNPKGKDICFQNAALMKNDILYCDYISDLGKRDYCYYQANSKLDDSSICLKITEDTLLPGGMLLRDKCYMETAIHKNDYTICQKMSIDSDNCLYQVSHNFNKSGCEFIQDSKTKTDCLKP